MAAARGAACAGLAALCLAGCRAQPPGQASDAGGPSAAEARDGGFKLTAPLLDGWLRYQRQWLAAVAGADGGADARELRRRARLDEVLRADAGLSEDDVDHLEAVVAAVATRRALAALTGAELAAEVEKAAAALSGEKRQQADQALAELAARAERAGDLSRERAQFGDAAVDLVLAREAEVRAVWDAMLQGRPAN